MRWLLHWGLNEPPFTKEIGSAVLWVPSSREPILQDILEACTERGHALLTGEPGVGKTCVLRALRHRLPEAGFRLTYCHNVTLGRRDFYRLLCLALGLDTKATAAAMFYTIATHVQQLGQDKVHPVLLIDEAHLLHQDVLEHLHILTNYEWDSRALLSVILVGLPETRQRLQLGKNRSLWSRIHTRTELPESSPADTAEYLQHRLRNAGATRELFTSDAIALIHQAADGKLRDIDRIATAALKTGAKRKLRQIDRGVIASVVSEEAAID
jgi:type II secretory pathway predicted ATPase ExeA